MVDLDRIIKDLQNGDLAKLYHTSRITPAILIHYSLRYSEFEKLLKKYKLNIAKFNILMKEHIEKIESNKSKIFNFSNRGLEERYGDFNREPVSLSPELHSILNLAQQIELRNLNNNPEKIQELTILHNNNPMPLAISILSVFEAFIKISQQKPQYSYFYEILEVCSFNISKFLKDAESGFKEKKNGLDAICQNLNELVLENKISKVIGRDKEIKSLILTLTKNKKNNPVLIGYAGVGKTAIAEGLAEMIVNGNAPKGLENTTIYMLEVANLVAGTSYRGQFEQKIMNIIKEVKEREKNGEDIVLFIDEIHSIVGSGNNNGLDLSNILKPALARGELRTIGATTTDEWHQFINDNKALKRRFIPIDVNEPNKSDTFEILKGGKSSYEKKHKVKYQLKSLIRAIDLSDEFINDNAQPDKSFDLIDIAGAMCSLQGKQVVSEEDIEYALNSIKSNISLDAIQYSKKKTLIPIEKRLNQHVFGQEEAINTVSKAIEVNLAGLGDSSKPIGSFLFLGKTGVGKTELAKNIAKEMNAHFERYDMSEYMSETSVNKLLGSDPGYVGYDKGSSLTKTLQKNPRTVLLLDEVEKANPKIFNLLLQAMDNAQITDSKGNKISFKNVLLIMTSNLGAKEMDKQSIGLAKSENPNESKGRNAFKDFFTPEFIGRLTNVIHFNPMNSELIEKIFDRELFLLNNNRLQNKNIHLKISSSLKKSIIKESLEAKLGARPLKNILTNEIVLNISEEILYGKLKNIEEMTEVTASKNKNGELILKF